MEVAETALGNNGNVACSSFLTSSTYAVSTTTMTKPTLLQSILGRPSQSYSFPSNKEYYSTKHELLRAAVAAQQSDEQLKTRSIASAPDSESGYFSSSSAGSQESVTRALAEVCHAAGCMLDVC